MNEEYDKMLSHWLYKYYELTGKKLTKTDVLNMLVEALLNSETIEEDILNIKEVA